MQRGEWNVTAASVPAFLSVPDCPICTTAGMQLDGKVRTFVRHWNCIIESRFRYCRSCEFAWMSDPLTVESLSEYYRHSDQYRRQSLTVEEAFHIGQQVQFVANLVRVSGGRHLEIGPDNGAFLDMLSLELGGELYFEEFNESAAAALVSRGMRAASGSPARFDTISLRHVFEHVLDPVAFIGSLRGRLAERGVIFIEVPDYSAVRDGESDIFQLEHLSYFSLSAVHKIACRAGLRIDTVEFARTPGYSTTPNRVMRVSLQAARRQGNTDIVDGWKALLRASDADSAAFGRKLLQAGGRRIALYGAGTLTMKLLAVAPPDAQIVRIFDADARKQGWSLLGAKVQPATTVDHHDFDVIVLTVVGYEAEVRRFLRESGVPEDKIVTIEQFTGGE